MKYFRDGVILDVDKFKGMAMDMGCLSSKGMKFTVCKEASKLRC